MKEHILLIAHEEILITLLQLEFNHQNYQISMADRGETGLIKAREVKPDLILLDTEIPGLSGLEICRRLRSTGCLAPILLISDRVDICDRVIGLDSGADDYLIKPFSLEELLARVRAHLRRLQRENKPELLRFGDMVLNRRTREVFRNQRSLQLTAKEFDLLEYLMTHPQQVITREQILNRVWEYEFLGNSNVIEVYIRYLRRKLEANQETRLIHTIRSVGYVLREDSNQPHMT